MALGFVTILFSLLCESILSSILPADKNFLKVSRL